MFIQEKKTYYSKIDKFIDLKTLFLTLLLVVIGLFLIYSGTYIFDNNLNLLNKQIIATLIGSAIMIIISFLPTRLLKLSAILSYAVSIILLVLVLLVGIENYGTRGWLHIASFTFQPAEFSKIAVILMLGYYLSKRNNNVTNIFDFIIILSIVLLPFILINLQPDFGSSIVLIVIFIGVLFWAGFDSFYLLLIIASGFSALVALKDLDSFLIVAGCFSIVLLFFRKKIYVYIPAVLLMLSAGLASPMFYNSLAMHQKARIDVFLNPGVDPQGSGYNVLQSMLAVGSGGITGKGYLEGTLTQLRYIPMQWTDFIFSVPAEEFGLIGSILLIGLLLGIVYRATIIANMNKNRFYSIISFATAVMLLFHIFINIGMVIGLVPVMGIPLPFISQGGSSLIVNLSLIGLLMNAHRNANS